MRSLYNMLGQAMNGRFATDLVGQNPEALAEIERNSRETLARVRDPDPRARLTPDYAVGCKRLVISEHFHDAIHRPNARLITDPIAGIEPQGVRTRDGALHELDALVFATGFDSFNFHRPMKVIGRGGRDRDWAGSSRALLSELLLRGRPEQPDRQRLVPDDGRGADRLHRGPGRSGRGR